MSKVRWMRRYVTVFYRRRKDVRLVKRWLWMMRPRRMSLPAIASVQCPWVVFRVTTIRLRWRWRRRHLTPMVVPWLHMVMACRNRRLLVLFRLQWNMGFAVGIRSSDIRWLWSITLALKVASDAVVAMRFSLVALLLPATTRVAAGLSTVAEVALALAAVLSSSVIRAVFCPIVVCGRFACRTTLVDCVGSFSRLCIRLIRSSGLIDRVQMRSQRLGKVCLRLWSHLGRRLTLVASGYRRPLSAVHHMSTMFTSHRQSWLYDHTCSMD